MLENWERYVLTVALAIVGTLSLLVIRRESVTPDEVIHLTAGMSYLQRHDGRMNPEHPPLEKILAGAALLFDGASASYKNAAWVSPDEADFGWGSMIAWGAGGAHRVYLARLPMVLLTIALALVVFVMSRSLAEPGGGVLSLAVFIGSPFYFAYGPLVLTDIGVALFALLAVWSFASLWQTPDLKRSIVFALAISGAFLSKFSSGLLLPIFVVLGAWYALDPRAGDRDHRRAAKMSFLGIGMASVVVYFTYFIVFWKTDLVWLLSYRVGNSAHPKPSTAAAASLFRAHLWLARISYPVVLYASGVASTLHSLRRPSYLLGRVYATGTPLFFPALFLYKMTPGFLFLAALLVALGIWRLTLPARPAEIPGYSREFHLRAIVILFLGFTLAALFSRLNIGIRHLSVPMAALTVLMSLIVPWSRLLVSPWLTAILRGLAGAAAIAGCVSTFVTFPNYISYFNALRGDRRGYEIAVGADLDWGQSLIELRDFMDEKHIESIKIDARGSVPELYLPAPQQFECEGGVPDDPEWVAVGASRFITTPTLAVDPTASVPHCSYLFHYPSWVGAGGALYVFHLKTNGASVAGQIPSLRKNSPFLPPIVGSVKAEF